MSTQALPIFRLFGKIKNFSNFEPCLPGCPAPSFAVPEGRGLRATQTGNLRDAGLQILHIFTNAILKIPRQLHEETFHEQLQKSPDRCPHRPGTHGWNDPEKRKRPNVEPNGAMWASPPDIYKTFIRAIVVSKYSLLFYQPGTIIKVDMCRCLSMMFSHRAGSRNCGKEQVEWHGSCIKKTDSCC